MNVNNWNAAQLNKTTRTITTNTKNKFNETIK